ncbi:polypeptide N-acetylgalactosaminyltransferase 18-like isoform X3 [Paramormyrops kingsleyae]|uniref:polypeptide N-acetylgalactosaminyltransferase 18-like isoform X3 n=1 Tax=Paramormyrops kingsleyae TaxID=1676925 RepID=UPI000CD62A0F|nr:polypeptide N-acetylgalactosaminyltransferase 18-like isoform X3 [Paramormyrops kingsleyae]
MFSFTGRQRFVFSSDLDTFGRETPQKPDEGGGSSLSDSSLFTRWGRDLSPDGRRTALMQFQYYGYNGYLSDRLALDRPIPDLRPDGCRNLSYASQLPQLSIVFIFVNEALSVVLRSICSAIRRTPSHLLKEIILVDDNSSNEDLKGNLQAFVAETNSQRPGLIRVVRHTKREGLIRARVSGWRAATAPVVALFDAHVEFNAGWAEPILQRIKEDRTRIVSPSFDNIKYDTFEVEEYPLSAQGFDWELWCRYLNPPKSWWNLANHTAPIRSPALIGCFVVDREYFEEIGLLDEGMEVYGGENVELSVRVWQCGGSVEVLPCARVAHIERAHKPYTEDLTAHVRRNALRVAEVWMDDFKSHVYMAWNIPQEDSGINIGDVSERKALRKRLQCRTFQWYLENVYPEMRVYTSTVAYGVLQNSLRSDLCLDQGPDTDNIPILYVCHGMTPQNVYYTSSQQLHMGVLSPTIDDDDNKCLVDVNGKPRLLECGYARARRMKLEWLFIQGGAIQNKKSKRCLELKEKSDSESGYQLALQQCSGQSWSITNLLVDRSS